MHSSSSRKLVVRENHNSPSSFRLELNKKETTFGDAEPLHRALLSDSLLFFCLSFYLCFSCLSLYGCPRPKEADVKEDLTKYMDQARSWVATEAQINNAITNVRREQFVNDDLT